MLIQSDDGIIRILPSIPDAWKDVSFDKLRAMGAFLISIEKKNGKVIKLKMVSEKGSKLKIENPFKSAQLAAVRYNGDNIRHIKDPDPEVQLEAVRNIPAAIRYIKNPCAEVQLEAITGNRFNIIYVKDEDVTRQMIILASNDKVKAILVDPKLDFIDDPDVDVEEEFT